MEEALVTALAQGGPSAILLGMVLWKLVPAITSLAISIERMDARLALAEDIAATVAAAVAATSATSATDVVAQTRRTRINKEALDAKSR